MKLLSPIKIGNVQLKNRVVSTAHAAFTDFWDPRSDGERYIAYQRRRAEGGCGMVILTAMHVHESSQKDGHFIYQRDDIIPKYRKMADAVHAHDCKVIQQIFHFGAVGKSDCRDDLCPLWSMSGTPSRQGEASHEMTNEEIEEVIEAFVETARVVVEGGLDGVELHATHGYLLIQSLSPLTNRRKDKWGDPLKLITTIAERVRSAIGPDKVMGLRISADDFVDPERGGLGPEKLRNIAKNLIDLELFDYLNHSEGGGGADYARAIGSFRHKFGEYLPLTRGLKDAIQSRVPVIGVGKIPTPDLAEQALNAGDCDMVGMTRAQIADPDLVNKVAAGQSNFIRICTGSNQGCIDRTPLTYPITCFQNPEVGQEQHWKIDLVEIRKKVLVVGGGPAGMKAAEIAAKRGFDTTLVESSGRLGGRLNWVESLGDAANLLAATAWVEQELNRYNVNIMLQTAATELLINELAPDHVIVATGATPSRDLNIASDHSIPVISTDDAAQGLYDGQKFDMQDLEILLVDLRGNLEVALVAEALVRRGARLTIATPFMTFGPNVGFTHLDDLSRFLHSTDCTFKTLHTLSRVDNGQAILNHVYSSRTSSRSFDLIVSGNHPIPSIDLFQTVRSRWPGAALIGDAVAPRTAMECFREGDRAARKL